jgi:hypothetical protein
MTGQHVNASVASGMTIDLFVPWLSPASRFHHDRRRLIRSPVLPLIFVHTTEHIAVLVYSLRARSRTIPRPIRLIQPGEGARYPSRLLPLFH